MKTTQELADIGGVERRKRAVFLQGEGFELLDVPAIPFESVRRETALDFEIVQKRRLQNRTVTAKYCPRTRTTARSPAASMDLKRR